MDSIVKELEKINKNLEQLNEHIKYIISEGL